MIRSLFISAFLFLFSSITFSQNISFSADSNGLTEESASTVTVTATLDATAESSIKIPITLAGTASKGDDYSVSFSTFLNTTNLYSNNADYRNIISLTDGRYIIYENGTNNIKIIDFDDQSTQVDVSLARNYNYIKASNDLLLGVTNNQIYQLSISGDTVSETLYHELLGSQGSFNNQISIEGSNVLFNTLENNGERNVYLKQGSNDPEQIYSGNSCCWVPLLFQGRALMFAENGSYFSEIVNNSYSEFLYLASFISPDDIKVFNDKIYAKPYGYIYEPTILEVNIDAAEAMDAMSTPSPLTLTNVIPTGDPYALGFDHYNHDFTFDSLGNLIHITEGDEVNVRKFQLSPEIKISSGSTSGTVTFTVIEDALDAPEETLTITAGIPTAYNNGSWSQWSGTVQGSTEINVTITDANDPSSVTFAFSSDTVTEGSDSVTLTATADPVSGLDITVPLTLSGTASSDEYSVSASEIVIPAGSDSASVTIAAVDDEEVEAMETIIFTIGDITNGTTDDTEISLNLDSDDDPEVTSIEASSSSFAENESITLTATTNAVSSRDVMVPFTFSGDATSADYTTDFDSKGEETLMMVISEDNNYHPGFNYRNGKYFFVAGSNLRVYDPATQTNINYSLPYYVYQSVIVGNYIYGRDSENIYKFDISNLNNITPTTLVQTNSPISLNGGINVIDGIIYYNTYQSISGVHRTYSLVEGATPVLMDVNHVFNHFIKHQAK